MSPQRKLLVLGSVAAVLIVTPIMLAAALAGAAREAVPESPSGVVARIDTLCRAGRFSEVDPFIDYRAKGRFLVPDLWDAAPEADREAFVALLKDIFKDTWTEVFASEAFKAGTTLTEMAVGPDMALVEQVALKGNSAFRWWLERRGDRWIVVDRTLRNGTIHNEPSGKTRNMRAHMTEQLGHAPTLREFVDNAPSWMARIHVHRFRVDDLLGK